MNDKDNNEIIDLVEKTLTPEELTKDYVDIKQASQILNNVSTKTAKKYIDEVSESHGFKVEVVTVTSNGGVKKLYKKESIITISRILNKDKTVLVHVPVNVSEESFQDNASSNSNSNTSSNSVPTSSNTFQESSNSENNQKMTVSESIRSISELRTNFKEFATNLRELNDNVRAANSTMQNVVGKIVEQGIDLKERYLEDRIKRTEIEKQQTETLNLLLKKNTDAEKLQADALKALLDKTAQSEKFQAETLKLLSEKKHDDKPNNQILFIVVLCILSVIAAGWGAFYFFTTNQQKMENQFESKLSEERQIQKDQFQETIKQLKESLTPVTSVNAAIPQVGQGK
jgi:hypothetical protein